MGETMRIRLLLPGRTIELAARAENGTAAARPERGA